MEEKELYYFFSKYIQGTRKRKRNPREKDMLFRAIEIYEEKLLKENPEYTDEWIAINKPNLLKYLKNEK